MSRFTLLWVVSLLQNSTESKSTLQKITCSLPVSPKRWATGAVQCLQGDKYWRNLCMLEICSLGQFFSVLGLWGTFQWAIQRQRIFLVYRWAGGTLQTPGRRKASLINNRSYTCSHCTNSRRSNDLREQDSYLPNTDIQAISTSSFRTAEPRFFGDVGCICPWGWRWGWSTNTLKNKI